MGEEIINIRATRVIGDSWKNRLSTTDGATRALCDVQKCVSAFVWTEPGAQARRSVSLSGEPLPQSLVIDGVHLNRQVPQVDINEEAQRLDLRWVNDPSYASRNMFEGDWRLGGQVITMANVHQVDQAALGADGVKNFCEDSPLVAAARRSFFERVGEDSWQPPSEGVVMLPRSLGKRRVRNELRFRTLKETVPEAVVLALSYQVVLNQFQRKRLSTICREIYRKAKFANRKVWIEQYEAEAAFLYDPYKWTADAIAHSKEFESYLVTIAFHIRANARLGFSSSAHDKDDTSAYDSAVPSIFFQWDFLRDVYERHVDSVQLLLPVHRTWSSESPYWPALQHVGMQLPEIGLVDHEEAALVANRGLRLVEDNLPVSGKAPVDELAPIPV